MVVASISLALPTNVEAPVLAAGHGDDTLGGGASLDRLLGGAGNDVLDGASGFGESDWLAGGPGDDAYATDSPSDIVSKAPDAGRDTVFAAIPGGGYVLARQVEDLVLLGTTRFGLGHALDNRVTDNAGANWLAGGAGDDPMDGGAGDDLLLGGPGVDLFLFARGSGADRITNYTPGTDHIRLAGFGIGSLAAVLAATARTAAR